MKNTDTSNFKQNVYHASKSLRVAAMRFTRNSTDANDLIQETLLKALSNIDKYQTGTNLKAWLFTIMRNTFISNYHKVSKRNRHVDLTENITMSNRLDSTLNGGVSNICNKEIIKAITDLDKDFRVPFMMHYEGFKYHEIAEQLNIPMGTVKNRIHVARQKLMEKLKPYADKVV